MPIQNITTAIPMRPIEAPQIDRLEGAGASRPVEVSTGRVDGTQGGGSFGDVLIDAVRGASAENETAVKSSEAFAQGRASVHEVMIAQERASIALRYVVTLKNRAIEAYRELMNTPV